MRGPVRVRIAHREAGREEAARGALREVLDEEAARVRSRVALLQVRQPVVVEVAGCGVVRQARGRVQPGVGLAAVGQAIHVGVEDGLHVEGHRARRAPSLVVAHRQHERSRAERGRGSWCRAEGENAISARHVAARPVVQQGLSRRSANRRQIDGQHESGTRREGAGRGGGGDQGVGADFDSQWRHRARDRQVGSQIVQAPDVAPVPARCSRRGRRGPARTG